mmetsp:Transcript_104472/g.294433  ORF Transcript_104472/g.294433 Transcript_104472/m.294433 type:complete len:127 (-) Transcript_104472:54-434(-)
MAMRAARNAAHKLVHPVVELPNASLQEQFAYYCTLSSAVVFLVLGVWVVWHSVTEGIHDGGTTMFLFVLGVLLLVTGVCIPLVPLIWGVVRDPTVKRAASGAWSQCRWWLGVPVTSKSQDGPQQAT